MGPLAKIVDHISSKLAFFPPRPATYQVKEHADGTGELYIQPLLQGCRKVLSCTVLRIPSGSGRKGAPVEEVIAAYIPYTSAGRETARTILFSHGNAVDLGQMLPFYRELAKELRCNVMGYDYTGYGCSSGQPSVAGSIANLEAVYTCLLERYNRAPDDIVLYGQSVGSGPSVDLAARTRGLAGCILHSPLMSGMRVLNPGWNAWPSCLDVFVSSKLVPRIDCPLLVMHGTEDEVIDVVHGRKLHSLAQHPSEPLWAEGHNHQDLEMADGYLPTLKRFMREVWPECNPRR
jgi:pimeloyl-ACP methyl ester carboxylesterase